MDEELEEVSFEGFWSRFTCPHCDEVFDVEGDVSNGEEVECDACGAKLRVTGR